MRKKINLIESNVFEFAFASALILLIIIALLPSCNSSNNVKTDDAKIDSSELIEAKLDAGYKSDTNFLVGAAKLYLEEIQLAQLVETNSMNTDVRGLAKMTVAEHTKTLNDLQTLATAKQITIPTSLDANGEVTNSNLMDKKGNDFDKEYCIMMVNSQKGAIDKFEKVSTDGIDPDIREWAITMIPELRSHLDRSIYLQKQCEKL